ncbi:hypothetical protein FOMPIDRAFT_1116386, partial [Fomitopsis schrenkii]
SQVRICLHTVGTPLADFQSTRELIVAFRDAIEGHRRAYELGGVIHRDISEGNVMMARHCARFHGFIHDFAYSFKKPDESKVRTVSASRCEIEMSFLQGTKLFMAIEILSSEVTHEARHDLESFYWLLVYILLRHTNHDHPDGKAAFGELFTVVNSRQFAKFNFSWITYPAVPLTVPGNAPLNALLEGFRDALVGNFPSLLPPRPQVTHAQILALFDQALAVEDWPKDDAALKWVPPADIYVTEEVVASSGMLTTKGTRDDSTATHSLVPRLD